MSDPGAVSNRPVMVLSEAQQMASSTAVRLLTDAARSMGVSSNARLPSVVPLSSLSLMKPKSRTQIFSNIDRLLQPSNTSLQGLIEQQIPPGADVKQRERAENVLLATLISLPPSERAAVMQDPARLQTLCKNAVFGSLVSTNDKICAVCASNTQKSPAYQGMANLPEAMRPLAHQSAQRLEMLMARNPDLDEKQREAIRAKAMEFFQKATFAEDLMTFPSPFAAQPSADTTATVRLNSEDASMLHFGYLLKSLGEETYKPFDIPDQVYMQKEDGKVNEGLTLNAWLRRDVEAAAPPAPAPNPANPKEVQLRKVDPPRVGGGLHKPRLSEVAAGLNQKINEFYRELSANAGGATVHKETKDRMQQLLEYADAFSLAGLQPDGDGKFTSAQVQELFTWLGELQGLLDGVRACVPNCDEGSGEAQLMRDILQYVNDKIRPQLGSLEALAGQMAANMPKDIKEAKEALERGASLIGMAAGLPVSMNQCVQSVDQFISKETMARAIAMALIKVDSSPTEAAQQIQGLLSSGGSGLVQLLLIHDLKWESPVDRRGAKHPLLQKLVDEQPEFKEFVQGNEAIKAAFVKAGITGLD